MTGPKTGGRSQTPGVALVRQLGLAKIQFGASLIVPGSDGNHTLGLAADYIGWAEGQWPRVLVPKLSPETRDALSTVSAIQTSYQDAFLLPEQLQLPEAVREGLLQHPWIVRRQKLVGIVAPETDISRLLFEIIRTDINIEEGRLVEVQQGDKMVLYQIVNGMTREEIIQQKHTYGYVRAEAKKIGYWGGERGFDHVRWLPALNQPVFLVDVVAYEPTREAIGHLPGTNYPISIDINPLITHNAAILGILGSGKSFLALELVERMAEAGIKVVCLDLTNQYVRELQAYYDETIEQPSLEHLMEVGKAGKANAQQNVEEGGSINQFADAIREDLRAFVEDARRFVKIYNPTMFEVWRQDSRPYQNRASMASLTPTEITRVVAEALLDLLQQAGMSERAQACLVLEEAHSLIPEWNAVASEGDKSATNGTAKAILQGRKFGLGCIVVTQRTANVTKSILNQCNTVFALRVFDATGMEFLKNYVGQDYAGVLSTLPDRHAVVFGRASSCRTPVVIRLNDRDRFIATFRRNARNS